MFFLRNTIFFIHYCGFIKETGLGYAVEAERLFEVQDSKCVRKKCLIN